MTAIADPLDHEVDEPDEGQPPTDKRLDRLAIASVIAAITPIVVATVRALHSGWVPIGDNSYFYIRSHDVFTSHPPLLGTWTSASISVGKNINNPGPLLFDVLAIPVRLSDDWGVAIGSALINIVAVIGIALLARRIGGAPFVILCMGMAAATEWTMGSELLYEPWQPHILILPFLCLLLMTWALLQGDVKLLPFAAFLSSFIVQSHVGYLYLVAGLVVFGVVGLAWRSWRTAKEGDAEVTAALRRRWRNASIAAGVVAVVCWAQPVFEQLTSNGEGNLSRLASSAGQSDTVGAALGVRVVSSVLSLPPWWGRPSFSTVLREPGHQILPGVGNIGGLSSVWPAAVSLLVLVLVLVAAVVWTSRRGDRVMATGLGTALFTLVVATATTTLMPVGVLGIAPHQVRWLWPLSIFVTFTLVMAVVRSGARHRVPNAAVIGFAVVAIAFAVASVPESAPLRDNSGNADPDTVAAVVSLNKQLGAFEGRGTVLFDPNGIPIFDPYPTSLQAELLRRGVDFVVDDPGLVRQLGEQRANHGQASVRLFIREGEDALNEQPGAQRVALVNTGKIKIAVFLEPLDGP